MATHWTCVNDVAFAHKMAFDFIAQIEQKMQDAGFNQDDLSRKLGVSKGSVSQILNNPQNLTLKTIAKYARVLGIKASVVAYDDGDPQNSEGLISSAVFTECWRKVGCPRDFWSLEESTKRP